MHVESLPSYKQLESAGLLSLSVIWGALKGVKTSALRSWFSPAAGYHHCEVSLKGSEARRLFCHWAVHWAD